MGAFDFSKSAPASFVVEPGAAICKDANPWELPSLEESLGTALVVDDARLDLVPLSLVPEPASTPRVGGKGDLDPRTQRWHIEISPSFYRLRGVSEGNWMEHLECGQPHIPGTSQPGPARPRS